MIAGLERCSEGEIVYRGKVVDSATRDEFLPTDKRNMGMVFQSYAIWPNMSAAQRCSGQAFFTQAAHQPLAATVLPGKRTHGARASAAPPWYCWQLAQVCPGW
jgi:ABC-type molybdate transport system ATPase subunit